ncbi:MAG TPA: arylsulfatase, partial [Vicinamibacterales bacterium]|nr:arylsulfatase [Vicinamibacterales bacterium]
MHDMVRASLALLCAAAVSALCLTAQTVNLPARPNIVLIALDDVGFSDLGAFGSEISTPHIDALAKRGLRYVRFDTNAICSATRASLLTGRNAQTVRMTALASTLDAPDANDTSAYKGEIPRDVEFLPEALRRAGYATFAVGKWHLSPNYETGQPGDNASFPLQRGFDSFYGFKMGWTDQYRPDLIDGNAAVARPDRPDYQLSADLIDHAIDSMRNSRRRAPERPFFLYVAMPVAHTPTQVSSPYIDRYAPVYEKGWDRIRAERFARQQSMGIVRPGAVLTLRENGDPAWDSLTAQQRRIDARFMAAYAGYLQYGDEQIGRLLDALSTDGIEQNTIVVLLSDNGPASETKTGGFRVPYGDRTTMQEMDEHLAELGGPTTQPLYQRPWAYAGATPLRRYKLWPYLGGIRTPLVIAWPGRVADPGAIRSQYVHVSDIAPTLLDAAGASFRDGVPGRSIVSTVRSAKAETPHSLQFFELWGNRAITSGRWRAVSVHEAGTDFSRDLWQLFDVEADPTESRDLAAANPAKLSELQRLWQQEAAKYGDLPLREAPAASSSVGAISLTCTYWDRIAPGSATRPGHAMTSGVRMPPRYGHS